jgi:hypothetical protein
MREVVEAERLRSQVAYERQIRCYSNYLKRRAVRGARYARKAARSKRGKRTHALKTKKTGSVEIRDILPTRVIPH